VMYLAMSTWGGMHWCRYMAANASDSNRARQSENCSVGERD
jgi:hypothetical protein